MWGLENMLKFSLFITILNCGGFGNSATERVFEVEAKKDASKINQNIVKIQYIKPQNYK